MAWEPAVERRQRGGGHRIRGSPWGPGGAAAVPRGVIAEDSPELLVELAGDIALQTADDLALGLALGGAPGHIAAAAEAQAEQRQEVVAADRPALLHQQSWEIEGGSLSLEIRSNRALPAAAFIQIGKLMAEVEKLKAILVDGSDSGDGAE
jgi:hypothetical protein